jgi:subtilisin family serine protease
MSAKKRYLISIPEQVRLNAGLSLPDIVAGLPKESLLRGGKAGTQVVALSPEQAQALAREHAGMLIEEDQDLTLLVPMPGIGFVIEEGHGQAYAFAVRDAESSEPIAGAAVFIKCVNGTYRGDTGADGTARIAVFESSIEHVIVSPAANYWSRVIAAPAAGETSEVTLTRLVPQGARAWGREWLGLANDYPGAGKGVKIAILDSGVAEHPDLAVAGGVNTLDGEDALDFRRDEKGHGTHCAGVIAGRNADNGIYGVAPEAEIYSVKVFPGGRLSDLVEGIQWCIDKGMDVISMSLGMREPSAVLAMKIAEAANRGIILVAAAGNDGGALRYPAANEGVIAVAAFGAMQSYPTDSAHALRVGELRNDESGLFVANMSNRGPGTAFIAPGVAIVSSVPGGYAAWDGTSMACPFVAGLAAVVLSAHPKMRTGDARQLEWVKQTLAAAAIDLSLPDTIQGAGVPRADQALAAMADQRRATEQLSSTRQQDLQRVAPLIADLEGKQQEIRDLIAQLG